MHTETVTLAHRFLENGDIEFRIWNERNEFLRTVMVRNIMFSWHPRSLFGQEISISDDPNGSGLQVPATYAFDWLLSPRSSWHRSLELSEALKQLINDAHTIQSALISGDWKPDFANWQRHQPAFCLNADVPTEIQRFFNAIIRHELSERPLTMSAWQTVIDTQPKLPNMGSSILPSEMEHAIQIGWKIDAFPCYPSLYLYEPELSALSSDPATARWMLAWHFTDRADAVNLPSPEKFITSWPEDPDARAIAEQRLTKTLELVCTQFDLWTLENVPNKLPAFHLDDKQVLQLMESDAAWFEQHEIPLCLPQWMQKARNPLRIKGKAKSSTSSGTLTAHLMQFDWQIAVGDQSLRPEEFWRMVEQNERLYFNGREWVAIDADQMQQIARDLKALEERDSFSLLESLRLRYANQTTTTAETPAPNLEIEWDPAKAKLMYEFEHFQTLEPYPVPDRLMAQLRTYQQVGMTWLLRLRELGLGGILADDMGLGKTIQWIAAVISFRSEFPSDCAEENPVLIICPTSVLGNWRRELNRFAPHLRVLLHHGPQRKRDDSFLTSRSNYDLVITSYTTATIDEAVLTTIEWQAIALDEAQTIKNAHTKQSQTVRALRTPFRIALTGTPVENHANDLWSIMQFLNPGYLGSQEAFAKIPPDVVRKLMQPFLLRRLKNDPAIRLDLPDKIERTLPITLTAEQASLYESVVQQLLERIEHADPMQRRGIILSSLMKLKQLCNHPALMLHEKEASAWTSRSHKWDAILELTGEILERGEKCIIFTQFLEMGRHLEHTIRDQFGAGVAFFHGGLTQPAREALIHAFQQTDSSTEPLQVLILSLRAGGSGINLTAASHVIHADRWWNPAVEDQATDRAHRIGQTQVVEVHRYMAVGTLEERIDTILRDKKELRDQLIGNGEQWITELSTNDLRDMLSLRDEWIEER